MMFVAATVLIGEHTFCTICKTKEPGSDCYSCGNHVCPKESDCSLMVGYLGRRRLLCLNCIDERQDESPQLAKAAKALGLAEPA